MSNIILSIHPEHVAKILSGDKRFEFRTKVPTDLRYVVIYATKPVARVVAVAEVSDVLCDHPDYVWLCTHLHSGISHDFYCDYFRGRDKAYAISFKNVYEFDRPMTIDIFGFVKAPQCYYYIHEPIVNFLSDVDLFKISFDL